MEAKDVSDTKVFKLGFAQAMEIFEIIVCGTPSYSIASGTFFPVGTTTVTVLSETEESSCTFTVTVVDIPIN